MALRLKTILTKNSSKPAQFTRNGDTCKTESFSLEFEFEFEETAHPPVSVKGTLKPSLSFFSIVGDDQFSFKQITHQSKRSQSVVFTFDNAKDIPTVFRVTPKLSVIGNADDAKNTSTSAQIKIQEKKLNDDEA